MQKPQTPIDDAARVRSLRSLCVLDTADEERFDRVTRLVCRALNVPISVVSLLDRDRQWFKSKQGLCVSQTGRDVSFCGHTILSDEVMVVPDAQLDLRFADNPLVTDAPHIRFYAGYPVRGPGGHRIGTLCAIDTEPRCVSDEDLRILKDLTQMVECELALIENATIDELTGLSNLRGLRSLAGQILALSSRDRYPTTLVNLQLDEFKSMTAHHGHEDADILIRDFARLLQETFREADVLASLRGVSFALLLAGQSIPEARDKTLRLEEIVSRSSLGRRFPGLSWSAGFAQFNPGSAETIDDLLRVADFSMYRARVEKQTFGAAVK